MLLSRFHLLVSSILVNISILPLQCLAQVPPEKWSPWTGPYLNSPGVELLLKEERKIEGDGRASVSYTLESKGLPSEKRYVLWVKAGNADPEMAFRQDGFIVNESGQLICPKKPSKEERESANWSSCVLDLADYKFSFKQFHQGEIFKFAITSEDGMIKAYAEAIPSPLEATDRNCRIWAERITTDSSAYGLFGEGFLPNVLFHLTSESETEVLQYSGLIQSDGKLPLILLTPAVMGRKGGRARVTIETPECRPSLSYPWGNENRPQP